MWQLQYLVGIAEVYFELVVESKRRVRRASLQGCEEESGVVARLEKLVHLCLQRKKESGVVRILAKLARLNSEGKKRFLQEESGVATRLESHLYSLEKKRALRQDLVQLLEEPQG